MDRPYLGRSIVRKEGRRKLTGSARYVDDLKFSGMIYGITIRSNVPRAKIKGIRFTGDIPWDTFVIVKPQDIPGKNIVALIFDDQPYLAEEIINHSQEPLLLIAHADRQLLEKARDHIIFDLELLEPIFDPEESSMGKKVIWGSDNIFKDILIEKGDVDAIFKQNPKISSGTYSTGAQEQLYIETNGVIALASPEAGVTVWGSLQCPYFVHKALKSLFDFPDDKVRVVQCETGGGFGGKEEYPSLLAGHASLLAWKSGLPVKMIYDREEDMAATTKRHPSRTHIRSAVDSEGRLLALDIDFLLDGGAYSTLSAVVLSRGSIHATGPYKCENIRVRGRAVATNTPPQGAFRGFGAPQSVFALERHLDIIAHDIGSDPVEIRKLNLIKIGDTTGTSQVIRENVDMASLMTKALAESDFYKKREKFKIENTGSTIKRGMGIATFMHGCGFTGSGEKMLASVAGIEATPEGIVRVLAASTEIGQGTNTIFAQIVADAIGIPIDLIEIAQPDTQFVPNSGPTVASRTCMVVGQLIENCGISLKQMLVQSRLLKDIFTPDEFKKACRDYIEHFGPLRTFSQYKQSPHIDWDDKKYFGDAYGTYAWACYVAEVSVDTLTYEARVEDFVAVQEVGRVVNPCLAAGQIEGGVAQAIGFALTEEVVWRDGKMANNQMTNYIMQTSLDTPPIRVFFEEKPYTFGPGGAKGIGELPMDGPAPAILNALQNALGIPINQIPATPEVIHRAMHPQKRS